MNSSLTNTDHHTAFCVMSAQQLYCRPLYCYAETTNCLVIRPYINKVRFLSTFPFLLIPETSFTFAFPSKRFLFPFNGNSTGPVGIATSCCMRPTCDGPMPIADRRMPSARALAAAASVDARSDDGPSTTTIAQFGTPGRSPLACV